MSYSQNPDIMHHMKTADTLFTQWAESDEAEIDAAIAALFQHKHGRRFIWWLLEVGKIGGQPFALNSLQTAFQCGELNVGQRILDRVTFAAPDGYVTLLQEMNDERRTRSDLARSRNGSNSSDGTNGDGDDY